MSSTRVQRAQQLPAAPADRYGDFLTEARHLYTSRITATVLRDRFGLDEKTAAKIRTASRLAPAVAQDAGILTEARRVYATTIQRGETPVHIIDVQPDQPVLSSRPFALEVRYLNAGEAPVALVSVVVEWVGTPFTVEQRVDNRVSPATRGLSIRRNGAERALLVEFDEEHTLPVGPVAFEVTLFRGDGAESRFRAGAYVRPSNPLALAIGPAGARVTGSWSARGDFDPGSNVFVTSVEVTIANGDARAVAMDTRTDWSFWDGPVGSGTRVEADAFTWAGSISVPAHGVWRGTATFTSPAGSGIYDRYRRKEDMAIEFVMRAADGRVIRSEITTRVMLVYGVNVIKVGDFTSTEHTDLYAAVDLMRDIYEDRDITVGDVSRRIIGNADAGGFTSIGDEDEYRDMLEKWSCPNNDIDLFINQTFTWKPDPTKPGTYNGYAGDIPGPASKGGRTDGVAVSKSGFTDASGNARLDVAVLGPLMGHEIGHYLGLEHQETTDNLMRSNTGLRGHVLDYDQYRTIFPHGFVEYL